MNDRGAKALAERTVSALNAYWQLRYGDSFENDKTHEDAAELSRAILGEHGLFIPDVSKHRLSGYLARMDPAHDVVLECRCGWSGEVDSVLDHLVESHVESHAADPGGHS